MTGPGRISWAVAAAVVAAALPAAAVAADPSHVTGVQAPATALAGAPFDVEVDLDGTTAGSTLAVTRADTGAVVAEAPVAAGARHVTVRVTLPDAGAVPLHVGDAGTTVEVADFRVDPTSVLVPDLVGYGTQFNHSTFDLRLNPSVPTDGATLPQKVSALQPRLVRVFFPAQALTEWQRLASFQQVVRLAQQSGATVLVAWSGGYGNVDSNMTRLAKALADLVRSGSTNIRWVSLLNEPNGGWNPPVPKETYELMYRTLDAALRQQRVRDQIRLMGAGLVQTGQKAWLDYMVDHMSDVLDGYSIHVYWDYWDTAKLESRLNEVKAIDLRTGSKPIFVTEVGVRGVRSAFGVPVHEPGIWGDLTTPMAETNVTAFQLAWFNILASRLGYPATVTWDAFNAKYDSGTQDFSCIGPAPGFELRPCYHLLRLFTLTTEPGWRVVGVPGYAGGRLVTAYTGPMGQETLIGLDRAGAQRNDDPGVTVQYRIAGLPALTPFRLLLWNRDGTGVLSDAGVVTTDAAGVAVLEAPQQAVWALTTRA